MPHPQCHVNSVQLQLVRLPQYLGIQPFVFCEDCSITNDLHFNSFGTSSRRDRSKIFAQGELNSLSSISPGPSYDISGQIDKTRSSSPHYSFGGLGVQRGVLEKKVGVVCYFPLTNYT